MNIKNIAATLAILGSVSFSLAACGKKNEGTEVPAGDSATPAGTDAPGGDAPADAAGGDAPADAPADDAAGDAPAAAPTP